LGLEGNLSHLSLATLMPSLEKNWNSKTTFSIICKIKSVYFFWKNTQNKENGFQAGPLQ
jgi:hypothetical protein